MILNDQTSTATAATAGDGPVGLAARRPRRGNILFALCLAALVIFLETTIVNVTLPTLVRSLSATTTELQWIVDAYSLVFAALVLAAGSLGDRLGRKGILLSGLGVFAMGSLAGALSQSANELIAARAVMGVGAALILPATLSIIANVFTERKERAKAIGLWGATTGVGIATGPIVGGWLLESYWWGSVFLFLVPMAVVAGALIVWAVPTSRDPSTPPIDWRGVALSTAGMGALVLSIIQAPDWGWTSARTLAALAGATALLALFVVAERRTSHPMLDVSLFRDLRFTAASGSVTIAFFALQGFIFLITQYFQFIKGYTPLQTGVRLLPVAASVAIGSIMGTRLAVRVGNKAVVATGLALFSAGLLWTAAAATQSTAYGIIALQALLLGSGMGLTGAPATEAIMGAVRREKAGVGSAVNDATRLFGGTLGVAVIGSVAASLYVGRLASAIPAGLLRGAIEAARGSVGGALIASQELARGGHMQLAQRLSDGAGEAFMHSFMGGVLVAGGVAAAGVVLAATLLPARPGAPSRDSARAANGQLRPRSSREFEGAYRAPRRRPTGSHWERR